MNTQAILENASLTKTEKIRLLLAGGLTRRQTADLMGVGYGFVQNVFARFFPDQVSSRSGAASRRMTAAEAAQFAFTPFTRRFGIEIEAYGIERRVLATALTQAGINTANEDYNHCTRSHWKVIGDSSLNGAHAFELVSPILEGQAGLQQLQTVCQVLETLGAKINRTCGLHVHFDAAQLGADQVRNVLINYATYEDVIDTFLPASRRNNRYCQSIRSLAASLNSCTTIQQMARQQMDRYEKVNLQSYTRHGSIEFRQHSGTVEFTKIANWVNFLHNLVEFSRTSRAAAATFESMAEFQQPEIMNYLTTRINQLAA